MIVIAGVFKKGPSNVHSATSIEASRDVWWPNIGGSIYFRNGVTDRTLWTFLGGSFKDNGMTDNMTQSAEMGQLTEVHASKVSFSALDSSAIYNGTSMQPKSLQILPCIRT